MKKAVSIRACSYPIISLQSIAAAIKRALRVKPQELGFNIRVKDSLL